MNLSGKPKRHIKVTPLVISLGYALTSALWIIITDYVLVHYTRNFPNIAFYETMKGWLFILVTALLLYYLIKKSFLKLKVSNKALSESEEKLVLLNEELERRVKERTKQLEAANKELEAFSYSVSHVLRAPLRAIDGFSQILLDELSGSMPEEAKNSLFVIMRNVDKMEHLINDILEFAKYQSRSKQESRIEMEPLVRSVIEETLKRESERSISCSVEQLPDITGDYSMIRQVWVNLISNAVKFTKNVKNAQICIGGEICGNEVIYSIKDNGIGFNMKYLEKLFGVFQRLHNPDEFEGTGVGLAIVQRIVHRHNGKIWAEGEQNKGASFYFSLPLNKVTDPAGF